jgi:hypothetical protein
VADPLFEIGPTPAYVSGRREDRSRVEFDEVEWPCAPVFRAPYTEALACGRERMADTRIVLCGLARDAAASLRLNLARLERIGSLCADHRIVIFENDSRDGTSALLAEAARRDPRIRVVSETLGRRRWPAVKDLQRASEMADYRNRLQDVVLDAFADFDHVIVADLDLEGWSYDGLANGFGHDDWDVITSQGICFRRGRPTFYDGWAFRTHDEGPFRRYALRTMVFPRGTPPVSVRSAFSGLAIYRMAAFAAGRYGGGDCEHVVFHDSLARAGYGRVLLNPSMLSLYPDDLPDASHAPSEA